jgi:hypothetical protein
MFTYSLFLFILLSVTLLSSALEIFFSPEEINDMGIRLDHEGA